MKNKGMLKKAVAFFILSLSMIFMFSGVLAQATESEASEVRYELTFTPGNGLPEELDKGNTDYAYRDMEVRFNGEEKQALYDVLEDVADSFWGCAESLTAIEGEQYALLATIHTADLGLTTDELFEVYLMFKNDHPVYYYLSNTVSVTGTDLLVLTDVTYSGDRAAMENGLGGYLEIYASCVDATSEYTTTKAIHDALVSSMSYSYEEDGVTPEDEYWAHSIEGAVRRNQGVCEAYARTYQMLLNYYGIENVYVTGVAGGDNHAWNMVKLDDGLFYYVDATWNDTASTVQYFACGEDFTKDHDCDTSDGVGGKFLYELPETATDNYVKKVAVYENGELLGKTSTFEKAFKLVTDENGEYLFELIGTASDAYLLPEGEWPVAKLLEFSYVENDPNADYYVMVSLELTGDAYLNSDIKLNNISLGSTFMDFITDKEITLYARTYTMCFSGKAGAFGGQSVIFSEDEVYQMGIRIEGPEATLVSEASVIFSIFEAQVNIGTIYMNGPLFSFRGGNLVCDTFYASDVPNVNMMLSLTSFYNSKISFDVEHMIVEPRNFWINIDSPNEQNSYRIGKLQQISENDPSITVQMHAGTGRKIPSFMTIENFDDVRLFYGVHYKNLYDYTEEELGRLCDEADKAGDTAKWNFYFDLKFYLAETEKYPSATPEDIMIYKGKLLNIGTTDLKNLSVSYSVNNKEFQENTDNTTYYDVNDFLKVDSEGNVFRAEDEVIVIEDGVLTKATVFSPEKITFMIPDEVICIAEEFRLDDAVEKVIIPSSVQCIEEYALVFNYVNEFIVDVNNPYFTAIDGVLYTKEADRLVAYPTVRDGEFVVPDTVTEIAEAVFSLTELKKLTIPSSVPVIKYGQFQWDWTNEYEINCSKVESYAFTGNRCKSITFGSSVKRIEGNILSSASQIDTIHIWNPKVVLVADAFAGIDVDCVTVYGYEGSTAEEYVETYGEEYGLVFSALPAPEDPVGDFVDRIYTTMLERDPDANRQEWIDKLTSGTYTGAQIIDEFFGSQEFMAKNAAMSDEAFVTIMYRTMFDRDPDAGGLADWTGRLSEGYVRRFVMAGVVNSDEFKGLCNRFGISAGELSLTMAECTPGLSEQEFAVWQFVERLYVEVLGRTPDPTGMADWSDKLFHGGWTGTLVAVDGFLVSAEFMAKAEDMTNEAFVQTMYRVFFDRDGDVTGMTNWMEKLAEGYSRRYIYGGFTNSGEFQNVCDKYGITRGELALTMADNTPNLKAQEINIWNFVERLYMEVLGRPADPSGMADWSGKLLNGTMTGAQAAEGVIMSQEFLGRSENLTNEEYVLIMYKAFFNRIPEDTESINWVNALNNNLETRRSVFASFANAQEFANLCATYGITQGSVAK